MKNLTLSVLLAILLPACAPPLSAQNPSTTITEPALNVSITSRGNGLDRVAYKEVQRLLNEAVAKGVIDKPLNYRKGREGGFAACVLAKPSVDSNAFAGLVSRLKAVSVNSYTTFYKLTPSSQCAP